MYEHKPSEPVPTLTGTVGGFAVAFGFGGGTFGGCGIDLAFGGPFGRTGSCSLGSTELEEDAAELAFNAFARTASAKLSLYCNAASITLGARTGSLAITCCTHAA